MDDRKSCKRGAKRIEFSCFQQEENDEVADNACYHQSVKDITKQKNGGDIVSSAVIRAAKWR